jgi:predicted dinucleotide-binding enzyme
MYTDLCAVPDAAAISAEVDAGLAIPAATSIAQMVAEAAPASAHVVKAFNTLFRDVLAVGAPRSGRGAVAERAGQGRGLGRITT